MSQKQGANSPIVPVRAVPAQMTPKKFCFYFVIPITFTLWFSFFVAPHFWGYWFATAHCREYIVAEERDTERTLTKIVSDYVEEVAQRCPFNPVVFKPQHAKSVACLRSTFKIETNISKELKVGLFKDGGHEYNAWVRFSTGAPNIEPDNFPNPRGMAIKLMGVKGIKHTSIDEEKETFDFLLVSDNVFFTDNTRDYINLLKNIDHPFSGVFHGYNPFNWQWRTFLMLLRMMWTGRNVKNVLNAPFYSATPYALGDDLEVKYVVEPCNSDFAKERITDSDNYLRDTVQHQLSPDTGKDACFNFFVQKRVDKCKQPLHDITVPWNSPLDKVATLTIPRQAFISNDQMLFCDALAFNPWRTTKEHTPLGQVNHARRSVYAKAEETRRKYNKHIEEKWFKEPTGKEHFGTEPFDPEIEKPTRKSSGDTQSYQFAHYQIDGIDLTSMPAYIRGTLPSSEEFGLIKLARIGGRLFSAALEKLRAQGDDPPSFKNIQEYDKFFDNAPMVKLRQPRLSKNRLWLSDMEWAAQWIRGVNPMTIKVMPKDWKEIPGLDVTPDKLKKLNAILEHYTSAENRRNIDQLRENGELYVADMRLLEGINVVPDCHLYIPYVLFAVSDHGHKRHLVPLAIQLDRSGADDIWFFPPVHKDCAGADQNDNICLVWLFAKIHAANADGQIHEAVSHLGLTHLLVEPVVVATHRNFAKNDIIYKMLYPHYIQTLAINDLGRKTLLEVGGQFDSITSVGLKGTLQLMNKGHKELNFMDRAFPREMAKRGFKRISSPGTSEDPIPGFLYRDYGWRIWDGIRRYVTAVLSLKYKSENQDKQVENDQDVQNWAYELSHHRFGLLQGFPSSVKKFDELVDICTIVIFTASVQHSAVNFGQFEFYGFIPNRPLALTKPMPEDLSQVTQRYIIDALPNKFRTIQQMSVTYILSLPPKDFHFDSEYLDDMEYVFSQSAKIDPHISAALDLLSKQSRLLEEDMVRNNTLHDYFYPYLYPSNIATSINI